MQKRISLIFNVSIIIIFGTGIGIITGYLVNQSGDSGAGGISEENQRRKHAGDTYYNNDTIGDFMTRGFSLPEKGEDGQRNFSSRAEERAFLYQIYEDKINSGTSAKKIGSFESFVDKFEKALNARGG
jgi:hypothetical protein